MLANSLGTPAKILRQMFTDISLLLKGTGLLICLTLLHQRRTKMHLSF